MATAKDPTFAKFTSSEGKAYAASRGITYPPKVFQDIIAYHGGDTALAVDVGCGPGNVTRDLAKYFDHVIGLDNSQGMVDAAESFLDDETKTDVSFRISPAEKIDQVEGLETGSVDVITSAVAIHWFDFPAFYEAAARILRPGGTIAAWVAAPAQAASTFPNADKINAIFDERSKALDPYKLPPNILADNLYEDLPLPWTTEPKSTEYESSSYQRIIYSQENGNALMKSYPLNLDRLEKGIYSASPYVRWKEANPELAGGDEDIAKVHVRRMREVMGTGVEICEMEVKMVLVMFKKKA